MEYQEYFDLSQTPRLPAPAKVWMGRQRKGEGADGFFPNRNSRTRALSYLKALDPVALWVPGMQTDGFRVDGDTTHLTQLTDLSGNGNHAVQATAVNQAYLEGNSGSWTDLVFSGGQWYDATGISNLVPNTFCFGYKKYNDSIGYIIDIQSGRIIYGRATSKEGGFQEGFIWTFNVLNEDGVFSTYLYEADNVGVGDAIFIGSRYSFDSAFLIGTISTLALYNKTLTIHEQAVVNQCLNILGGS